MTVANQLPLTTTFHDCVMQKSCSLFRPGENHLVFRMDESSLVEIDGSNFSSNRPEDKPQGILSPVPPITHIQFYQSFQLVVISCYLMFTRIMSKDVTKNSRIVGSNW